MKPLNLDNSPCSPTSSNCVIWQGPTIDCIKLCKGDSVSEVVAKLATELCTVLDQLNVTNYDLSCFNLSACPPEDFQALIRFLIDHVCALENITPGTNSNGTSGSCPDCVVTMASCFVQGTQTTMQLVDYVTLIAERICSLIDQIGNLQTQINALNVRVTTLEGKSNTKSTYTLPSILLNCTLQDTPLVGPGGLNNQLDIVLEALINDSTYGYCALTTATGLPAEITSAIGSQCITDSTVSLLYNTPMSLAYPSTWVSTPQNVADAITDMWISICDVFSYLTLNPFKTTVVEAGTNVTVTSAVVDNETTYTVNAASAVVVAGANVTVTPATVGTETTYTVSTDPVSAIESFVGILTINSNYQPLSGTIPTVSPGAVAGLVDSQIITRFTSIISDGVKVEATPTAGSFVTNGLIPTCNFGSFDNETTGYFTITQNGTYALELAVNLKSDNSSSIYWQTADTGLLGIAILGMEDKVFAGQYQTSIINVNKNIDVTTSAVAYLTVGTIIRLGVLNLTDNAYSGITYTNSDEIKFSITKLN